MQIERLLQDELRSGQRALGGVHEQENAVHHRERTLHLAAEIGVPGGVDDVDLDVTVADGGVLGENGDAPLPLEVVGVHHPRDELLVLAERARLPQHMVHEGGLPVIHVRDDGNIPYVFGFLHSSQCSNEHKI